MEKKTQQNKVFIVRKHPEPYLLTEHQTKIKEVFEACGIKKGISRTDLVEKLTKCVPEKWKEIKGTKM